MGIRPGQPDRIRWVQGTPDLRGHTVPAHELKGLNGHLDGLPLRGPTDRAYDVRLADQHMGIRYGFRDRPGETAGDQFRAFRRNNDYVWHHYSRHEVTLVDGRLHRSIGHQYYD